jgi:hypothetical protein
MIIAAFSNKIRTRTRITERRQTHRQLSNRSKPNPIRGHPHLNLVVPILVSQLTILDLDLIIVVVPVSLLQLADLDLDLVVFIPILWVAVPNLKLNLVVVVPVLRVAVLDLDLGLVVLVPV